MKLELKHLAPYLPYGLRVHYSGLSDDDVSGEFTVIAYHAGNGVSLIDDGALEEGDLSESFYVDYDFPIKPILRPLSDITEAEARSFLKLAHGGYTNFTEINIDTINKDDLYLSSELSDGTIVCLRANHTLDGLCISTYSIATNDNTTTYPTPLFIYNLFFKHHFDVFNLIDKNLAIDKTEIK